MPEPIAQITVCQGEPKCMLKGDEASAAISAGCPWCDTCYLNDDGSETWVRVSDDTRKA